MEDFCRYCAVDENGYMIEDAKYLIDRGEREFTIPLRFRTGIGDKDAKCFITKEFDLFTLLMVNPTQDPHLYLCVFEDGVYDDDFIFERDKEDDIAKISIPINYCPMCGRKLKQET